MNNSKNIPVKKTKHLNKCLEAINKYGSASIIINEHDETCFLCPRGTKLSDWISCTRKQANELIPYSINAELLPFEGIHYHFTSNSLTSSVQSKDNFVEELKKYFKEIPRDKVLEDWNKTKKYDTVGPTIKEFLQNINENKSMEEQRNYDSLKDVYKIEEKSLSLYHYLLANNEFNRNKLFHRLTKKELIIEYKELVKKHLKLLEEL